MHATCHVANVTGETLLEPEEGSLDRAEGVEHVLRGLRTPPCDKR